MATATHAGTTGHPATAGEAPRRVRHDVRDGVAVMVFSAAASLALAGLLVLVVRLAVGAGN